ncbi:MAG TPA: YfhO family protein, partial [Bryobacteraceae bacterium]|nr:YfhO family protein [Bryobacteraceae bacterium]
FGSERTRLLYGSNYAVARKPTMAGEEEVFRDSTGLIVYKNPSALPRVWTVHQLIVAKNPQDADRLMHDSNFDLRNKTFGYSPASGLQQCEGDSVESFKRDANSSTAVVDMKCAGMLVESENDAPGWSATIDGQKAPIYQAYTALRGVVVGPGKHTIEMRYRPLSVMAGAAATFSAFLAALALCLLPRLQRRQNGV